MADAVSPALALQGVSYRHPASKAEAEAADDPVSRGVAGVSLSVAAGEAGGAARPQRKRQEHDPGAGRGVPGASGRVRTNRGATAVRAAATSAGGGLPGAEPGPADDGLGVAAAARAAVRHGRGRAARSDRRAAGADGAAGAGGGPGGDAVGRAASAAGVGAGAAAWAVAAAARRAVAGARPRRPRGAVGPARRRARRGHGAAAGDERCVGGGARLRPGRVPAGRPRHRAGRARGAAPGTAPRLGAGGVAVSPRRRRVDAGGHRGGGVGADGGGGRRGDGAARHRRRRVGLRAGAVRAGRRQRDRGRHLGHPHPRVDAGGRLLPARGRAAGQAEQRRGGHDRRANGRAS